MIVALPSRSELISWVNQLTNANITKLEQLSDGIQFCQIFDKIYPKIINLHKLKRDLKFPLEKEKNFKMLLNAINQMNLSISLNITDLSHGKVSSILQLLQWFHKQFKNPNKRNGNQQMKDSRLTQPNRMIRSYVGNLVNRQKSYQRNQTRTKSINHLKTERRSLDAKHFHHPKIEISQIKEKNQLSQQKQKCENPNSGYKKSYQSDKKFKVSVKKEEFENACKEKIQSMKKMKTQKKDKNQSLQQILKSVMNEGKNYIQHALIEVSETAANGNPQLEEKIKMILNPDKEKDHNSSKQKRTSPDSQVKNFLSSYVNTSQICEADTVQENQIDKSQPNEEIMVPLLPSGFSASQRQNNIMSSNVEKKQINLDRKQTVKKSSMKSAQSQKVLYPSIHYSNKIKEISANKHNEQYEQDFQPKIFQWYGNQDSLANQDSNAAISSIFNPHLRGVNPETAEEEKTQEKNQIKNADLRRMAISENLSLHSHESSNNEGKLKSNFTQNYWNNNN